MKPGQPLIFNIRRFALDDGPGIRTTVFLKGCPLSCIWCHNPESMDPAPAVAFYPDRCILCGDCRRICSEGAVSMHDNRRIKRQRCSACGRCADICPAGAVELLGRYYPARELVEILMKDLIFYGTSGGGVTFSGGEPALHGAYLKPVMKELKKKNIHIAIQTSGMFDLSAFRSEILPFIDIVYYDIKFIDRHEHEKYTGRDNITILDNFQKLAGMPDVRIIPRVPLVPGITATVRNLTGVADFIKSAGCEYYELLPYNSGGIAKRHSLGRDIPAVLNGIRPDVEKEKGYREIFARCFSARVHASSYFTERYHEVIGGLSSRFMQR